MVEKCGLMEKREEALLLYLLFLLCSAVLIIPSSSDAKMALKPEAQEPAISKDAGAVYIVYMEKPNDEPKTLESKHVETLASVLGSQEAAQAAILYSYKHTVNGFSAKLTSDQASALSEMPGVLQVVPSGVYQLHNIPSTTGGSLNI